MIYNAINNTKTMKAIEELQLSSEEINKLYSQATVERVIIDESKDAAAETSATLLTSIFPVLTMPFFILNIFLVQMIGSEVNDEKTTKSMEIIISSVSPVKHFFSKVIAGNLFILIYRNFLIKSLDTPNIADAFPIASPSDKPEAISSKTTLIIFNISKRFNYFTSFK